MEKQFNRAAEAFLKPTARRLLNYMREHGGMTGQDAILECGVIDYRKRISEMRRAGYRITDVYERSVNKHGDPVRYKRYSLKEEPQ